jgi:hypothetical protein
MAGYRVPRHPHIEHHARRQTKVARVVGLALLWILAGIMAFVADRAIPPQHLPWKPLRVIDPVGAATKVKAARLGADPAACRAILQKAGVYFAEAAPETLSPEPACQVKDALRIEGGMANLTPADAILTCREALSVSIWERQVVQTAADDVLGQGVTGVLNYGSYSCRRIYNQDKGPMSEHATANALDVAGFKLADGSDVLVERDWNDPGPKGVFLHRVRDGACKVFLSTLSPDYNEAHHNHLHLDMGGGFLCR